MPMPMTTNSMRSKSVLISVSIPATFFPRTTTSFGHLMAASRPVASRMPSVTASAVTKVSIDARSGRSFGRSKSDIQMPLPGGELQLLPLRPLPAVCSSATKSVGPASPSPAARFTSRLVESVCCKKTQRFKNR